MTQTPAAPGSEPAGIPVEVPDLRGVPLSEVPGPALDLAIQRVLPGRPVVTVTTAGFTSFI
jgi:FXSXX-COOH protein